MRGSLVGGIFGGLGVGATLGLFASGGIVRGPGTGTSDSIPARVSNGEFIVNARATGRHRQLLEAINANRLPAFANGGPVSAPAFHGQGSGILTHIRFEVVDRAGVEIEQSGSARKRGNETIIHIMVRRLKEEVATDIAGNGPVWAGHAKHVRA